MLDFPIFLRSGKLYFCQIGGVGFKTRNSRRTDERTKEQAQGWRNKEHEDRITKQKGDEEKGHKTEKLS